MITAEERTAKIDIGGREYELLLTTRAVKEIAKRYGGLEQLGDKMMSEKGFEASLDELVWLICLLANQPIMIQQLRNPQDKIPLLTVEEVELLTTPADFADYKNAITEAMTKGTLRNIESEDEGKNAQSE